MPKNKHPPSPLPAHQQLTNLTDALCEELFVEDADEIDISYDVNAVKHLREVLAARAKVEERHRRKFYPEEEGEEELNSDHLPESPSLGETDSASTNKPEKIN
jgi:hypothetical protein